MSGWDFSGKNLTDAQFSGAKLTSSNLSGANLTNTWFGYCSMGYRFPADLTGANLGGAEVRNARFTDVTLTSEQLYSTASYNRGDLSGIRLGFADLGGGDFAGMDLSDGDFAGAILTDTDLDFSDLRGTLYSEVSGTSRRGAILSDGRIDGLVVGFAERLVVRNDNGHPPYEWWMDPRDPIPITVESHMSLDPTAALQMVFEDDDWASIISFEPGIDVSLNGTLELTFAPDTSPASLIGTTFDLFNWDAVAPTGTFASIATEADAVWGTSNLYTTGEVTLLFAVPEPSTLMLLALGVVGALRKWGV